MLKLSYNANGLREISITEAIREVAAAGYEAIELSLHPQHLDPFQSTSQDLKKISACLKDEKLAVSCLATGADNLLSPERFEPSLIHASAAGRRRRVDLIKRAIDMARELNIEVLNFASGIRKEGVSQERAHQFLCEGLLACLDHCGNDVILAMEPEPEFFIETNGQVIALIESLNHPQFRLSQDVGHTNVCEEDYLHSIERAMPFTRHIQVEDIKNRVHFHEIPGDGHIDFHAVLGIYLAHDYDHYVSVELYNHTRNYREALRRSHDYLRKVEREILGVDAGVGS